MKIEKNLINPKYYGDRRQTKDIKYIVIMDINNKSAPNYHVTKETVYQLIPDEYMSNAVNGARMSRKGCLHGICTKYNSLSVGVTDKMSDETKRLCVNLIMTLKMRHKVDDSNIVRQLDVTGKPDPERWFDDSRWKSDIKDKLAELSEKDGRG